MAADEREQTDVRALLNFGHTLGHAIEHAAGAGQMLHGEALSLGLIAAAAVSVRRAGLSAGEMDKIRAALAAHHLPTTLPPEFPREKIFAALARDKKFEDGRIRFVVAHEIGRASVSREVTLEDLRAALDATAVDVSPVIRNQRGGFIVGQAAADNIPSYSFGRVFWKYSRTPSTTPSAYSR